MKQFDYYETIGVIAPGIVLLLGGVFLFFPEQQKNLITISNISIGGLGLGLILAYVAGQLLQAVGNGLEKVWWWFWGGMPSDWIRENKHELVSAEQRELVQTRVKVMLNNTSFNLSSCNKNHWNSITRQIYAAVSNAGCASRVYIFNGNYGLLRGIAAGLITLLIGMIFFNCRAWHIEITLAVLSALAGCVLKFL